MNLELGFGYPGDEPGLELKRASRLHELADIRLVAVPGFLGSGGPRTRFMVCSRGSGPGGTSGGSFEDQETARMFRQQVQQVLGLAGDDRS